MFSSTKTNLNGVIQIHHPNFSAKGIELYVKRIDLPDPVCDGNKKFKLKYNVIEAKSKGYDTVLTFGGAYSNHIVATAAICKEAGLSSIGVIRGEELKPLNPSLHFAREQGMNLHFISREDYRQKENKDFLNALRQTFGSFFLIPEGGANLLGVKGCTEILKLKDSEFDIVALACGTGTTLAGIVQSLKPNQKALGIAAINAKKYLEENIMQFTPQEYHKRFVIIDRYHFGGFAKQNDELKSFVLAFKQQCKMEIEPIYTGKLFFGLNDRIAGDNFSSGSKILAIHTGGLQYLKLK